MLKFKKVKYSLLTLVLLIFSLVVSVKLPSNDASKTQAFDPIATCQGIANDENNNKLVKNGAVEYYHTLLKYDVQLGDTANTVNVASTTGQGILFSGVKLSEVQGAIVDYAHGSKYLKIQVPKSFQDSLGENPTLEVINGTRFENYYLDSCSFTLINNKWKKSIQQTYEGLEWNDIGYGYFEGKNGVLIKFNQYLSTNSNEYNGGIQSTNFASTIGENIYVGGKKLSTLPGAMVNYHSQYFLFIYCDGMSAYRTINIPEGTRFLDSILPEINLYYKDTSTKWTVGLNTNTNVTYSSIVWNDVGYETYKDKNGILIEFSDNLSSIQYERDGGIREVNFAPIVGDQIYLGGNKLSSLPGAFVGYYCLKNLFIYADNMPSYRTLQIIEGTKILNAILPEVNLYYKDKTNKWTIGTQELQSVTYTGIVWNDIGYEYYADKKGLLLSFSGNLSKFQEEYDGGIRSIDFSQSTGEHIYLGGAKLSTLPGAFVSYHCLNNLFIYADNMSSYRTFKIEGNTSFLDAILPEVNLNYTKDDKWSSTEKEYESVIFSELVWNNVGYEYYVDMKGVLISFDANLSKIQSEFDGGIQALNFASSLGQHIYLGSEPLSSVSGAFVSYHSQNLLFIYAPTMTSVADLRIESTNFLDVTLPDLELYFNGSKWTTQYIPLEDLAICQGIANDENNNKQVTDGGKPYYHTLLKYDVDLGTTANTTNVVSTTGEGILLNGVKLSQINGAKIDYAHGTKYLHILIPKEYQDSLTGQIILETIYGTHFESKYIDYAKFVLQNGKWSTYKEPEKVKFSSILWNNSGKDVYEGKNGILISYSANLSNGPSESKGSMKTVNLVNEEIGSKIKLDGTALKDITDAEVMYYGSSFIWVYVPNMTSYNDLTIESFTFFNSFLPNSQFSLFDNKWAESYKVTNYINGVKTIKTYKAKEKIVINEEYFADLFNVNLDIKLVSFKIGDKIYKPGDEFTVNSNVEVNATVVGFQTTSGAAIKMNPSSEMRFESKIDKETYDYLLTKYGSSNVKTGTYIVSKALLGLETIDSYFASHVDYTDVVNESFVNSSTAEEDGYYQYFGTLTGIVPEYYTNEYVGIGYIKVTDDDNSFVVYGGDEVNSHTRSAFEVVKRAYDSYEIDSNPNKALNSYLDGIVSLVGTDEGIEIESVVDGYVSPYLISFNSSTNEYEISGNSNIKTVLFNGKNITDNQNVIVNAKGKPNKIVDYSLNVSGGNSMLKFKLSPISEASTLVDFLVEMPLDREMKILQLTDTQIIDSSQMRSADRLGQEAKEKWGRGTMDKNCFNHMQELIDKENPDLILFTGDIIYGEFDDSGEILTEIVDFMESLGIPWAPIFGNHDNESKKGVDWQCALFENAEHCLFKQGNLTGNGNYSIGLIDSEGKIRRTIYMLDSNGCLRGAGLGQDQLDWVNNTSNAIDSAYGEKIPAFMCFHIPSIDFRTAFMGKYHFAAGDSFNLDEIGQDGDYGQKNENLSIFDASIETNLKNANVDGVFAGHDHVNNYSILYNGIRYTYGTKTGIYDYYNSTELGGTLIRLNKEGQFEVTPTYLDENEIVSKQARETKITVMSDIHHDTANYGGFYCLKSLNKLRTILQNSQDSRFLISLGDIVNSQDGSFRNYYDVMAVMKEFGLNIFNSNGTEYEEGGRMMYNLLGNHEVAYDRKELFKDYAPYVEGVGSTAVFKYEDLMFVAVDALFTRDGYDDPEHMLTCTEFMIPDNEINYLKNQVSAQMDASVKGIVWISHIALQDIDVTSKGKLLNELKFYDLPMTVFEGHTHVEKYQELKDEQGKVYCQVYTLPAVVLYDNYPYYDVIFRDGKIWCVDKHNGELK